MLVVPPVVDIYDGNVVRHAVRDRGFSRVLIGGHALRARVGRRAAGDRRSKFIHDGSAVAPVVGDHGLAANRGITATPKGLVPTETV